MSGQLRRRYQRLLFTYPTDYRAAHGEEILGTLLEAARPTQRWPSWRESTSLLLGGLRLRAREAAKESPTRLWTDGLHLGVLLVVLVNLGHALQMQFPLWIALVAVGALAVLRGWGRPALAATAIAALAVARPLLPQVGLPWWLPGYGDWSAVGRYVWPAVVLAVLAWPGVGRLRPRSWWWLLLPAAQAALPLTAGPWSLVKAGAEMGLLLAVLVVAVGALDPRPAIAAAVYLVPGLLYGAESIAEGASSTLALGYWMVLAVFTTTLAAAPGESGDSSSPSTNLPPTPRQAGKPVRRTGHAVDRCRVDST